MNQLPVYMSPTILNLPPKIFIIILLLYFGHAMWLVGFPTMDQTTAPSLEA